MCCALKFKSIIYIFRQEKYIYSEYIFLGIYSFFKEVKVKMNYGFQNEENFVILFNNKFFYELDSNSKNAKERYIVCVRWNFIKGDIIIFKNNLKC